MESFNRANRTAVILVTAVFLFLTLPALLQKGMFFDGVVYAAISRNLASGDGSFWHLHYTQALYPVFYEHPPLSFFMQSVFFKVLGNSYHVERIYSFIMALTNVFLIATLWRTILDNTYKKKFWWIPILLFIITPVVLWSFNNNMIENTLSAFTLAAFLFAYNAVKFNGNKSIIFSIISGLLTLAAFLTKGPAGLFPIGFPLLISLFSNNFNIKKTILLTTLVVLPGVIFIILLLFLNQPAADFFRKYYDVQILASIYGEREITKEGRFYLLQRLANELLPMVGIAFIACITILRRNIHLFKENNQNKKYFYMFLILGLSASIPLLISPKQHGYYLIPALPFFSVAFGIIILQIIYKPFRNIISKSHLTKAIHVIAYITLIAALVYSLLNIGKYRRDAALLKDIDKIKTFVPAKSVIGIPKELFDDWTLHAYMMRNAYISMECNKKNYRYYLERKTTNSSVKNGYIRVSNHLNQFNLYIKTF